MAPNDNSKRSKKSKKKNQSGKNKAPKETSIKEKGGGGGGFQRMDQMDRLPSNAPTMAIAPSDYEHIFHEGPPPPPAPVPTQPPRIQPTHSPSPPPPVLNMPKPRTPEPVQYPPEPLPMRATQPMPAYVHQPPSFEVQVTPDGYTLLGQVPDGRRVPLPPYVVRANNQFSRPVLAKVARYLLSRSDVPR